MPEKDNTAAARAATTLSGALAEQERREALALAEAENYARLHHKATTPDETHQTGE